MDCIDIIIRPLKLENINKNYMSWFRDNQVSEYFYKDNKKHKAYSAKLYVVCDNLSNDLEKFKKWKPICLSGIV